MAAFCAAGSTGRQKHLQRSVREDHGAHVPAIGDQAGQAAKAVLQCHQCGAYRWQHRYAGGVHARLFGANGFGHVFAGQQHPVARNQVGGVDVAPLAGAVAEAQDKIVAVKSPDAAQFAVGEQVIVGVRRSAGAVAVILAYVGALAVLLAVLVAAVAVLGWSEGRGALAALGAVGVYYCVLWLFRHKIEHTIHFSITKHY